MTTPQATPDHLRATPEPARGHSPGSLRPLSRRGHRPDLPERRLGTEASRRPLPWDTDQYLAPNVVAGQSIQLGIGFLGVALAFGLTVMTMAYAVGHVSGAHFNPAVTIGAAVAGRFEWRDVPAYVITQVLAGLLAGAALFGIARGKDGFEPTGNMAANGYAEHSPSGYGLVAVLCAEVLLTAFFLYIILGSTDSRAPVGFAPIAIGLGLTLIHLVSIPISNTSVNPARSTAVAFFNGNGAPGQLWLFWVAPILGAAIAGATYHLITSIDRRDEDISGQISPEDERSRATP